MLSLIFGKKSDHPLADIQSVRSMLEGLPRNDAHKSLMELTEWIESLAELSDIRIDQYFAALSLLDEAAQPHMRKLAREYFTPQEINKVQENRLWLALSNFSHQATVAYYSIFNGYCNVERGSAALKPQLPLITARTIRHLMWHLKFVCARYGRIENETWSKLVLLYKHAEQLQYASAPVQLYPGVSDNTSVIFEFGHLFLWYDIGLNSLNPLQMHLTERIIAQYASTISIHTEIDEQSRLCFDLNRPTEPARINLGNTVHPAMRFIGMPTMRSKLEGLMKTLNKHIVPNNLALGGGYDAEVVINATQHVMNYLISPPTRRKARRETQVTLSILNGFDKIFSSSNANLEPALEKPARWLTSDISLSGFSSILPKDDESIGVSTLLGIQMEGAAHWGVGVVRRLFRDHANQLRAGVEILTSQAAGVFVSLVEDKRDLVFPALWLYPKQGETHDGGEILLLLQANRFLPTQSLKTQLDSKNYLLIPVGLQGQGIDYDLAKFKLVEQDLSDVPVVH